MNECLMRGVKAGVFDTRISRRGEKQSPLREVCQYELEYFWDSEGVSFVDGVENKIEAGSVLIVKPGQMRYSILPFKCYYLYLPADHRLASYLDSAPLWTNRDHMQIYWKLFNDLATDFCLPYERSELLMEANILKLVYQLCTKNSNSHCKKDNTIIQQAKQFIDDNYQKTISLKDIAKAVNLSPTYFREIFSAGVQKSPHRYLLEQRIRAAKNALIIDDSPIVEIAYSCGFSSQSYFNYVFKKETGQTPNQFIKHAQEKDFI